MPMYSFICQNCGHPFEKKLRMSQSDVPQACPACGSDNTRKRIGAVAMLGSSSRTAKTSSTPPVSSPFT
ncbi:MAG: zinc ribbon domain-containing protein [Chloroflexi bacterium]|nr:MAG: zinc ribbon domain-containing protein [Chloroflexota bacterium]